MSGKGSAPRPFAIKQDEYAAKWDAIFKKPASEPDTEHGSEGAKDGPTDEGQA